MLHRLITRAAYYWLMGTAIAMLVGSFTLPGAMGTLLFAAGIAYFQERR